MTDTVTAEKTYEEIVTGVTLTLSADDARNLKAVCGAIAARGETRATTDRIWSALSLAGITGTLRDGYGSYAQLVNSSSGETSVTD